MSLINNSASQDLAKSGYHIFKLENIEPILEIRKIISDFLLKEYNIKSKDDELNKLSFSNLAESNIIRKELIDYLNNKIQYKNLIWNSIKNKIYSIFGPDIVAQKRPNLVIHSPGMVDNAPVHRDSPPHSKFDIVAWIPLVDVFDTSSMFIANIQDSTELTKLLNDGFLNEFDRDFIDKSFPLNINFGNAVLFLPELWHAPKINVTKSTRWAINTRYRGLFYPSGAKGIPDYFDIISMSEITKLMLGRIDG